MNNHPDRTELLQGVKSISPDIQSHLESCQDCHEIYKMMQQFQVAGKSELINAPAHLIEKAVSLIGSSSILQKLKSLSCKIAFDSWANLQPASVRNSSVLDDRRVQIKAENFLFDLRAEKENGKWNFTAQVSIEGTSESDIKIAVGKKEFAVNEFGLIQWSSKLPPKKITLTDKQNKLELPEITWKFDKHE